MPASRQSQKPKRKAPKTAWKKGQSGNPSGMPKVVGHVRELARQHTEAAIETLAEIMRDKDEKGQARTAAATALLDRGYGRPTQPIDAKLEMGLTAWTDERLYEEIAKVLAERE